MAYDDLKEYEGKVYTGMAVGGEHIWIYPHGLWRERKVSPDRWEFTFTSLKERDRRAPEGSGVPPGTQFHWYIVAHQYVRKLDADTYHTFMSGLKYKVAHKRPYWQRWSCEYPNQPSERDRLLAILEDARARLRGEGWADSRWVAESGKKGFVVLDRKPLPPKRAEGLLALLDSEGRPHPRLGRGSWPGKGKSWE